MSLKPKPLRQCGTWREINAQLELAGAVLDHTSGDHCIYQAPSKGTIVTKAVGPVCAGTRASVIRMARLAGLKLLLALAPFVLLAIAFQYHLL